MEISADKTCSYWYFDRFFHWMRKKVCYMWILIWVINRQKKYLVNVMEYLKRLIKMVCYLPLTIKEWHKKRNFYKKFSKRGIHYNIMPSAKINFNDGSSACDCFQVILQLFSSDRRLLSYLFIINLREILCTCLGTISCGSLNFLLAYYPTNCTETNV